MRGMYIAAAALGLACLMSARVVPAKQTVSSEKASLAQKARQLGIEAYEDGDFAKAADAFTEAYKLNPAWKLLYNIGQADAAAKRYGLALEAFEKYLSDGGDEVPVDRGDEVRKEIERLKASVGYLEVTAPENTRIFVDDIERGVAPLTGAICVNAAKDQMVRAELDGKKEEKIFRVQSGLRVSINLLQPEKTEETPKNETPEPQSEEQTSATPSTAETPTPAKEPHEQYKPLKIAGWVSFGIGAAVLAGGAATGAIALIDNSNLDSSCESGVCYSDSYDQYYRRNNLATASTVLLAAGGTVAAVGIGLLIFRKIKQSKEENVTWIPAPNGFVLEGRF
jgi:tetratricopeptide (TPR) repeat protein